MGSQLRLKLQAAPGSLCALYAVDKRTQPWGSTGKFNPSTVSLGWSWAGLGMLGHGDSRFFPPSPALGEDRRDVVGAAGCRGVPSEPLPPPTDPGALQGRWRSAAPGAEPRPCCAVPPGVEILQRGCGQWEHPLLVGRREMKPWWVPGGGGAGAVARAVSLRCPGRCRSYRVMSGAKGLGAGSGAFSVFVTQSSRVWFRSMTFSRCFMKRATLSKSKRVIHRCVR